MYRITQNQKEKFSDFFTLIWHGSKICFIKKYKIVYSIELIDRHNDIFKCSTRYERIIWFNDMYKTEKEQRKSEVNILNMWFRKDSYNNMNLKIKRNGIEGYYFYNFSE